LRQLRRQSGATDLLDHADEPMFGSARSGADCRALIERTPRD
jgi:hypothetical protein